MSLAQAELLGLGRHSRQRLVGSGEWQRLDGPVYLTSAAAAGWNSYAWAGVLLGGEAARIGGRAAAHLHGILAEPPVPITVMVPLSNPILSRSPWEFRRERSGVRSPRSPGSPPRLPIEDVVLDLAEGGDPAALVDLLTLAVGTRHTSAARLRLALRGRSRHSRRKLLEELLGDVAGGVRSPLEQRYLCDVERAHHLPTGHRQQRAGRPYLRDVVYEQYRLVVELDGRLGHTGLGAFRDMRRDNVATLAGEASLRYGSRDIAGSPCAVAWQVGSVLAARGWAGLPSRCPLCAEIPLTEFGMV